MIRRTESGASLLHVTYFDVIITPAMIYKCDVFIAAAHDDIIKTNILGFSLLCVFGFVIRTNGSFENFRVVCV